MVDLWRAELRQGEQRHESPALRTLVRQVEGDHRKGKVRSERQLERMTRNRRRSRLRVTAFPKARLTAKATCGGAIVESATKEHHMGALRTRRPSRRRRTNASRSRMRSIKLIDQADKRARPLSRRDLRTARPARVLMRARNPCLRFRRRLLG